MPIRAKERRARRWNYTTLVEEEKHNKTNDDINSSNRYKKIALTCRTTKRCRVDGQPKHRRCLVFDRSSKRFFFYESGVDKILKQTRSREEFPRKNTSTVAVRATRSKSNNLEEIRTDTKTGEPTLASAPIGNNCKTREQLFRRSILFVVINVKLLIRLRNASARYGDWVGDSAPRKTSVCPTVARSVRAKFSNITH